MNKIKNFLSLKNVPKSRGFTLVEALIGAALFVVISVAIYGAFTGVLSVISASRAKIVAMDLANERFELIRNLPYADVGIAGGIPNGKIQHVETFERSSFIFVATTTIRNIDDPFDGTIGGTPNDLSPADSRLIEIEIGCPVCKNFPPIFVNSRVAPKNLETSSTNGALFVRVLNANGQPVPDASVHIVNSQVIPSIVIDDSTNVNGMLQIVDAPPGVNAYQITVTRGGYTSDRTYTPGAVGNPNPTKPHATVVLQQVTQLSFVIDQVSTLDVSSTNIACSPISSIDFNLKGTKLIGTSPDVLKYNQDHATDGSGLKTINYLEWDTYPITLTDTAYDLVGMNPILPISLTPNGSQNIQFIVAPKDPSTLLVSVRDASTQLPLASSTVRLQGGSYDQTYITDRGFINQTDWSQGGGQASSTNPAKYFSSSNIAVNNPVGEIKLNGSFGVYDSAGELISSTYDTGLSTNYHQLSWLPADQPPQTGSNSVKMQIATNNDNATWNFLGPDGTSATYYTSATSDINPIHDNNRYIRYKIFLSTGNTGFTPNVSSVSATFSSECIPPGQVAFTGLSNGNYNLTVSNENYDTATVPVTISSAWQQEEVDLFPE